MTAKIWHNYFPVLWRLVVGLVLLRAFLNAVVYHLLDDKLFLLVILTAALYLLYKALVELRVSYNALVNGRTREPRQVYILHRKNKNGTHDFGLDIQ